MISRRALLRQFAFLALGVGAAWWLRERYLFPKPVVEFPGGQAGSGWLPLPDPGGLIELAVHVRGIPVRAVVDSGAQFSAIDRSFAQRLGLKSAPIPMLAFGVSGEPAVTHTVALDLAVGPMQVVGLHAATLDLLSLSGAMRRPFALLLGRDLLSQVAADVDWPAGRVALIRPEAFRPPPGAQLAPTRSRSRALMTDVSIEGGAPVEVMVDTGATSEIALAEPVAGKLGLLNGRPTETGRSVSLGGLSRDRVVRAASVEFAGRRLSDVEVQIFKPAAHGPLPDGLLGVGILRRYRVGLDLGAGLLWLAGPERAPPARPDRPHAIMGGQIPQGLAGGSRSKVPARPGNTTGLS